MATDTTSPPAVPKMPIKQALALYEALNGNPVRQAAIESGLELREQLPQLMDEIGLDPRSILCRIREKLDAQETKFFQFEGRVSDSRNVEAHAIQLRAIELAAELRGLRRDDSVSIGSINIQWNNAAPAWAAAPAPAAAPVPACAPNGNGAAAIDIDNASVIAADGVGLSTIEGTGSRPGGLSHTNSANVEAASVISRPQDEIVGTLLQRMQSRKTKSRRKLKLKGDR